MKRKKGRAFVAAECKIEKVDCGDSRSQWNAKSFIEKLDGVKYGKQLTFFGLVQECVVIGFLYDSNFNCEYELPHVFTELLEVSSTLMSF